MELEFHQLDMKYDYMRILLPGMQARLMASLAEQGQQSPVLVVSVKEEKEKYVLIDGYRRVSALNAIGRDSVEAVVLPLDELSGLLFRQCRHIESGRSAFEDGWLLQELIDIHGVSQAELSRRLQKSESWVSRRISLVRELPRSIQDLVRNGCLSDQAAMKYLVPLARAKKKDCEELGSNLAGHRTTCRQMEKIYITWKRGDVELRKRIVEQPILLLKAMQEESNIAPEATVEITNELHRDLEIIEAVSARARRRAGQWNSCMLSKLVLGAWRSASSSFLALSQVMKERTDAGSGDQDGDIAVTR